MLTQLKEKQRHRVLEDGQHIRLLDKITNNDITLNPLEYGKIVSVHNNVEARVWFYRDSGYSSVLNLDNSFHKNGRFEGVVLGVKGTSFAVDFYFDKHRDVVVAEDKALNIPFFDGWNDKREPARVQAEPYTTPIMTFEYLVSDVITYVEDAFAEWVDNNLEMRSLTEEERESGDYDGGCECIFTNESQNRFVDKQYDLELSFAKQTGFYHHFLGGTVEV